MENLLNIEVYHIQTTEEGTFAHISYQDIDCKEDNLNNGYGHIKIPIKLRPIQLSIRGNTLIDQSEKDYKSVSTK